jgi:proteasome accessory factor B
MCPLDSRLGGGSGRGIGAHDKAVRVLKMAWLLQKSGRTVDGLAEEFGVSRRTVYRDLRLMDEAGLPLVSQQSDRGYRLMSYQPVPLGDAPQRPWA